MQTKTILGIDVGASGIKGAVVDIEKGELITERVKIATPKPSKTASVAAVVAEVARQTGYEGNLIGVGFPVVIKNGVSYTAANIDNSWIGANVEELLSASTGCKVLATNDADAAGLAEMVYGKGKDVKGNVLLITIGSGLGSALFTNGHLVKNTEFGHCNLNCMKAEHYVSNNTRKAEELTWGEFGKRFNEFLHHIERISSPDLIILGGGISNDFELFSKYLDVRAPVTPAMMFNHAGIIGAALYAYKAESDDL